MIMFCSERIVVGYFVISLLKEEWGILFEIFVKGVVKFESPMELIVSKLCPAISL
jgi:hypothetical protein